MLTLRKSLKGWNHAKIPKHNGIGKGCTNKDHIL
uniref:Uncharacterized protein n=1 Tax=Rhizophora mucronata TaxID=61149 RepID=A0A2P2NCZ0_RHIMU